MPKPHKTAGPEATILLRRLLRDRRLSISALARATGISRPRLSDIACGYNQPSWRSLHLIASALGLQVRLVPDPTRQGMGGGDA